MKQRQRKRAMSVKAGPFVLSEARLRRLIDEINRGLAERYDLAA